jgi:hypothetical protein
MPAADTVLLPICVALSLLGIIATGIAWRRGNKGRVIQGIGLTLAPIALYFTGLLRILWDLVVAVAGWAGGIIFSPAVWFGLSLLGLCIVLWVVGGIVARRSSAKAVASGGSAKAVRGRTSPPAAGGAGRAPAPKAAKTDDDDLADIEALLKKHGIE